MMKNEHLKRLTQGLDSKLETLKGLKQEVTNELLENYCLEAAKALVVFYACRAKIYNDESFDHVLNETQYFLQTIVNKANENEKNISFKGIFEKMVFENIMEEQNESELN